MTEIEFPSSEEVNELLTLAEALEGTDEYRRLLYAADGCLAEAKAYEALRRVVGA